MYMKVGTVTHLRNLENSSLWVQFHNTSKDPFANKIFKS